MNGSQDPSQPESTKPGVIRTLKRLLAGLGLWSPLIVVSVLCLDLEENFPLSHFPMYSKFSDDTFLVYVTDKDGEPLAVQVETLHRTGRLKKIYEAKGKLLKAAKAESPPVTKRALSAEKKRPFGDRTLEWLWENTWEEHRQPLRSKLPLHLQEVWIGLEDGEIVESEPVVVGVLEPGAAP